MIGLSCNQNKGIESSSPILLKRDSTIRVSSHLGHFLQYTAIHALFKLKKIVKNIFKNLKKVFANKNEATLIKKLINIILTKVRRQPKTLQCTCFCCMLFGRINGR